MELGAGAVDALHLAKHLAVGELLALGGAGAAAGQLGGLLGIDEELEGVLLLQQGVGGPADKDAVPFFGQFPDQPGLERENVHRGVGHRRDLGKALGKMDRVARAGRAVLELVVQEVRVHAGLFGEGGDDLAVIVVIAQFVGQAFSQFPSAAAELTAHGDDVSHDVSSVSLLCGTSVQLVWSRPSSSRTLAT